MREKNLYQVNILDYQDTDAINMIMILMKANRDYPTWTMPATRASKPCLLKPRAVMS